MDKSARDKALDKIRKCLALSKSANEHEAAAALRQAQKLMAMHGLSEDDLGSTEYLSVLVVCKDYEYGRRKPLIVSSVITVIKRSLGVEAVWEAYRLPSRDPAGPYLGQVVHAVRYFGPRARVIIAEHAHGVVYRAVGAAWNRYKKEWQREQALYMPRHVRLTPQAPPKGMRASFYAGWCGEVVDKVQALVVTEQEKAGIDRCKALQYRDSKLEASRLGTKTLDGEAITAGARAGQEFDMNRPIAQDRLRIEKL